MFRLTLVLVAIASATLAFAGGVATPYILAFTINDHLLSVRLDMIHNSKNLPCKIEIADEIVSTYGCVIGGEGN